ncbi:MAG: hypothetical protein ACXWZF_00970 [Actinomycetota bacterium]
MSAVVGYLIAAAVIVFGVYVIYRVIRSWRSTYRDDDRPAG